MDGKQLREKQLQEHRFNKIRHVGNQMIEEGFEPTLDDFLDWVQTETTLTEDRRAFLLDQQKQGKTLNELWGVLSEEETYEWSLAIELLIFAHRI